MLGDELEVFTVSKEIEFDAGHRVPNHKSKCRNPHGHRYRLRVTITGDIVTTSGASDEGMLADFGDLKTFMTEKVHDVLDHGFVAYDDDKQMLIALGEASEGDMSSPGHEYWQIVDHDSGEENRFGWKVIVVPFVPTAENLAKWCWGQLEESVQSLGFQMSLVELWETPTSLATYMRYQ